MKNILSILKNKYFLTFILLFTWLLFFDKNDILSQVELTKKLHQLEEEKQYFIDEIARSKADMSALKTDPESLERIAREKYLMKKDNEDIYIIVPDSSAKK